jgi:hypothetical protein
MLDGVIGQLGPLSSLDHSPGFRTAPSCSDRRWLDEVQSYRQCVDSEQTVFRICLRPWLIVHEKDSSQVQRGHHEDGTHMFPSLFLFPG